MSALLSLLATGDERDDRLGDIEEAYTRDLLLFGEQEAKRTRLRHALSCLLSIARRRTGLFLQDQVLPATAATLIALTGYGCLSRVTSETWWIRSGFARNPGYFVSENQAEYSVCEPFEGGKPGGRVALVPKSARIIRVYCDTPGQTIRISDDNYTRGRVLTARVGFRVAWEE